jgi:hypothetical protein
VVLKELSPEITLPFTVNATTVRVNTVVLDVLYYYYHWGETESLGTAATTGLLYQPEMIGDGECREIGGMKIGKGNRSTRRNPAPAPLYPLEIPHD